MELKLTKVVYSKGSELEVEPESVLKRKSKCLLPYHIASQHLWGTYYVPRTLQCVLNILPYLILKESF